MTQTWEVVGKEGIINSRYQSTLPLEVKTPKYQDMLNFLFRNFSDPSPLGGSKGCSLSLFSVKTEIRSDLCSNSLCILLPTKPYLILSQHSLYCSDQNSLRNAHPFQTDLLKDKPIQILEQFCMFSKSECNLLTSCFLRSSSPTH